MTFPYPYRGPIALFNNLPINAQFYQPNQFFISNISNGVTTTVTTTVNHNYVVGQLCRLNIPSTFTPVVGLAQNGNVAYQFNGVSGYVLSIPNPNQVVLNINSTNFDTFVTTTQPQQPQIIAIGDISFGNTNASGNLNTSTSIPGAYVNISPL